MKKNVILTFGFLMMIAMFLVIAKGVYSSSGEHIPEDWPNIDTMDRKLDKAGYEVSRQEVIKISELTFEGEMLSAEKGKDFIYAFWCVDSKASGRVYKFCNETYHGDYTLLVGNKVYCGTKKAVKVSGIILRKK